MSLITIRCKIERREKISALHLLKNEGELGRTSPVAGQYLLVHLSLEKRKEIFEGSGNTCRTISAAYSQPARAH
jgi:hypothetical protein